MSHSPTPEKATGAVITDWRPEDSAFWQQRGQRTASHNLWISVSHLLLASCIWILFSAVTVDLPKVGSNSTTDQLLMSTALPSVSGTLLRAPYSFMVPISGNRHWTVFSTGILIIPCVWLSFTVQDTPAPYSVFIIISLLCGFTGTNFTSSIVDISFSFPKQKQSGALGLSGGLSNVDVSIIQLVAPPVVSLPIFAVFSSQGVKQPDRTKLYLVNAFWIWMPLLAIFTTATWFGMNDLATSKAPIKEQLPTLRRGHLWIMNLLYLATFDSPVDFFTGFAMLSEAQFLDIQTLQYAFFGPFIDALAHSTDGALSDRPGRTHVTLVNFIPMTIFSGLLLLTLPADGRGGNSMAFFTVFPVLLLAAGLGSGSTFQMISVIFRKLTMSHVKAEGGSDERAMREVATDAAVTLGFTPAIGAVGGFFTPKAFSSSLASTGSSVGATKVFLTFYTACVVITWVVYGRHSKK